MSDALRADPKPRPLDAPQPLVVPRFKLALERREDAGEIDALIETAFGPGRLAKTAERLREGNHQRTDLCWCVWDGARLIGAVRTWPVSVGATPGVFLGPIAVEAKTRRRGLGALLVERVCEAATDAGDDFVLLVGDRRFFEPLSFIGANGLVRLPGPVDASRVLWRALEPYRGCLVGEAIIPALSRHARLKG